MAQKNTKNSRTQYLMEKCRNEGFKALSKDEASELFLSIAAVTPDASELYKKIVDGDPCSYFGLPKETLKKKGLSEPAAFLVNIFPSIANRCFYTINRTKYKMVKNHIDILSDEASLEQFLISRFLGVMSEKLLLLTFNKDNLLISFDFISSGRNSTTVIDISSVCGAVSKKEAHCVIIAHNHPSGSTRPSSDDCRSTLILYEALRKVGVLLIDHYIVTRNSCASIRNFYNYYNTDRAYLSVVCSRLSSKTPEDK